MVHEFVSRNVHALSVLETTREDIAVFKGAQGITQDALRFNLGKMRSIDQLLHMGCLVFNNFHNPIFSNGFTVNDDRKYRQTYPLISSIGIPLGNQLLENIDLGADFVTGVTSDIVAILLELGFVKNNPDIFFDKSRRALWYWMQEQKVAIPQKLVNSPTLFSRFDVVIDTSGKPWFVDATFQSGGIDILGFAVEQVQKQCTSTNMYDFNWGKIALNIQKELGTEFSILGGSAVRSYAQSRLRKEGVTVFSTLPLRLSQEIDMIPSLEHVGQLNTGIPIAFWWGCEHITDERQRQLLVDILHLIDSGVIETLNHPLVMALNESKATLALALIPGAVQQQVLAKFGNTTLQDLSDFVPERKLVKISTKNNKVSIFIATKTDYQGQITFEQIGTADDGNQLARVMLTMFPDGFLKSTGGYGARGVIELHKHTNWDVVFRHINGPKVAYYVLEPAIESLLIDVPSPVDGTFWGEMIPRVEVYTSTSREKDCIKAEAVGFAGILNPGRDDRRIHAGSNAVILPLGIRR